MKKYVLFLALIGLSNLLVVAQEQASSTVPELMSCPEVASKSEDMARFNEEPSDSILRDAVKELQVSEPVMDTVYNTYDVEKMPSFPGGESELQKFILEDINIPALNKDNQICSTSAISFVVQKNGDLTDFKILKDCGWANSLILALQSGPCWEPGEINDIPVAVEFVLPLRLCFR